ncbi:MAG TPA: class I SAM-dependent methyltransferase, partial [Candidatus Polarisedimenticolia bacterium]|nr:class I SAM-dependent methyltransferase [Candidatus Polarisedimenticolia bacterium]
AFGTGADASVRAKYGQLVRGYVELVSLPMRQEAEAVLRRDVRPGGSILIAGCGAGGEAIHLARGGYRVTGFDVLPAMVEAARTVARDAGVEATFLEGDVVTCDLTPRRFDAIYFTPMLYSFVAGHARRRAALARAGHHLERQGFVLFTAHLARTTGEWLEQAIAWTARRVRRGRCELGDWYTAFLTPRGRLARSYVHRGSAREARRAAREAGFRRVDRVGAAHFVAGEFAPSGSQEAEAASMPGQKS